MTDFVYVARYLDEDTSPWDGNESYGVWRHLEDAQNLAFADFEPEPGNTITRINVDWDGKQATTYTGHGMVDTWERVEHPTGSTLRTLRAGHQSLSA
ncbi:hypothetical protein [Streptomyces sp. NPDC055085]